MTAYEAAVREKDQLYARIQLVREEIKQEQDAVVPQERRPAPPRKGQSSPRKPCEPDKTPLPPLTIIRAKRHRGQMLRELERLSANGQSAQLWLMEIFRKLAKNLKSAGRWLRRNC